MCIGPKITSVVILLETGETKTRPLLRLIHLYQQKTFIVPERNIITRAIFLDQFAFEQN